MNRPGKTFSLWLSIAILCSIVAGGSLGAAAEQLKIAGLLTKRGKLRSLEFGRNPNERICRSRFSGTYLTTVKTSGGDFASRSIVTIYKDGNLSVADSAEFAAMFGQQQGSYRCTGTHSAKAVTLDFGFSDPQNIARSDWVMVLTPQGSIEGEITVNFFRPLESCNPLEEPSPCAVSPLGTFTFTSVRVEPYGS